VSIKKTVIFQRHYRPVDTVDTLNTSYIKEKKGAGDRVGWEKAKKGIYREVVSKVTTRRTFPGAKSMKKLAFRHGGQVDTGVSSRWALLRLL
jgi:hypothetical protein